MYYSYADLKVLDIIGKNHYPHFISGNKARGIASIRRSLKEKCWKRRHACKVSVMSIHEEKLFCWSKRFSFY